MFVSDIERFKALQIFAETYKTDDWLSQIFDKWREATPQERSWLTRQVAEHLKRQTELLNRSSAPVPEVNNCTETTNSCSKTLKILHEHEIDSDKFREALFWGVDYAGPGASYCEYFWDLPAEEQTKIVDGMNAGLLDIRGYK
jgi:hypothetical protein